MTSRLRSFHGRAMIEIRCCKDIQKACYQHHGGTHEGRGPLPTSGPAAYPSASRGCSCPSATRAVGGVWRISCHGSDRGYSGILDSSSHLVAHAGLGLGLGQCGWRDIGRPQSARKSVFGTVSGRTARCVPSSGRGLPGERACRSMTRSWRDEAGERTCIALARNVVPRAARFVVKYMGAEGRGEGVDGTPHTWWVRARGGTWASGVLWSRCVG